MLKIIDILLSLLYFMQTVRVELSFQYKKKILTVIHSIADPISSSRLN